MSKSESNPYVGFNGEYLDRANRAHGVELVGLYSEYDEDEVIVLKNDPERKFIPIDEIPDDNNPEDYIEESLRKKMRQHVLLIQSMTSQKSDILVLENKTEFPGVENKNFCGVISVTADEIICSEGNCQLNVVDDNAAVINLVPYKLGFSHASPKYKFSEGTNTRAVFDLTDRRSFPKDNLKTMLLGKRERMHRGELRKILGRP